MAVLAFFQGLRMRAARGLGSRGVAHHPGCIVAVSRHSALISGKLDEERQVR